MTMMNTSQRCLELGVKGYVVKNESGTELELAIQSVLAGKNYFSSQVQKVIFKKHSQNVVKNKKREHSCSANKAGNRDYQADFSRD